MFPKPVAQGMTLCDYALIEQGTKKITLVGQFTHMRHSPFPGIASPFCVYSALIGGQGSCTITLEAVLLRTLKRVYVLEQPGTFSDRLTDLHVVFRVRQCPLPEAGAYQFQILVDGEWVAQRRILVLPPER